MSNPNRPKAVYVIKRIKKAEHASHGGAWKIAYADFVTAMMAFFLLMWLMGSTAKGDLKGIADYFNNPMTVGFAGGSGSGDSSSLLNGGGTDLTRTNGQVKKGDVEARKRGINLQALKADVLAAEAARLRKLMTEIEKIRDNDVRLRQYRDRIRLDVTRDGLRIQIVDDRHGPMFDTGSAVLKSFMRDLLQPLGKVLNEVDNKVTLSGHTDGRAYVNGPNGYSNWELSADRANASRRELIAGGMSEAKIFRVVGLAASVPLNADDPLDQTNRRITIIVMNKDAEARMAKDGGKVDVEDADDAARAIREAGQAGEATPGERTDPPPKTVSVEAPKTPLEIAMAAGKMTNGAAVPTSTISAATVPSAGVTSVAAPVSHASPSPAAPFSASASATPPLRR